MPPPHLIKTQAPSHLILRGRLLVFIACSILQSTDAQSGPTFDDLRNNRRIEDVARSPRLRRIALDHEALDIGEAKWQLKVINARLEQVIKKIDDQNAALRSIIETQKSIKESRRLELDELQRHEADMQKQIEELEQESHVLELQMLKIQKKLE